MFVHVVKVELVNDRVVGQSVLCYILTVTTLLVNLRDLCTESGQTLEGSFSAVSTATIARVGAFFQIFRDLQDFHPFVPL